MISQASSGPDYSARDRSPKEPFQILCVVVDDNICSETPDQFGILCARCGRDRRTEMFGELNRNRSDTTGASLNKNLLAAVHFAELDQSLPCCQGYQGDRCGFCHIQVPGLQCNGSFIDGDE